MLPVSPVAPLLRVAPRPPVSPIPPVSPMPPDVVVALARRSESVFRGVDMNPRHGRVRGLVEHEVNSAGNIRRLERTYVCVPGRLAVRFHVVEDFGRCRARCDESHTDTRARKLDSQSICEHLQCTLEPAINSGT